MSSKDKSGINGGLCLMLVILGKCKESVHLGTFQRVKYKMKTIWIKEKWTFIIVTGHIVLI